MNGAWLVQTESGSIHLLEGHTDGTQWVTRVTDPDRPGWSEALRGDTEAIRILGAEQPKLGEPWTLALDLRGDGVVTYRFTTPVVSIRPANSNTKSTNG